jgi:hypothetical protein
MVHKILLPAVISIFTAHYSFSQTPEVPKKEVQIRGAATITSTGIGYIPAFSLGKPAAIFDLSVGKGRVSFDPQFRFSLKGEPWSFLFTWRYKIKNTGKFRLGSGASLGLNFATLPVTLPTGPTTGSGNFRYLIGELAPNYFISKSTTVGLYYLYLRGLDVGTINNTHFIDINMNFSHIALGNKFYARFVPHFFYLRQDGRDGFYIYPIVALAKNNFPLSIQFILDKAIQSDILGSEDFVWNVSLIYSFNKTYVEK